MGNENKNNWSIDIGFWEIVVICVTAIVIVSMFTGHFDKVIAAIKTII